MSTNSRALMPCRETAESVPKPMVTPLLSASLNMRATDSLAWRALTWMAGGNDATLGITLSSARSVGMSTTCFAFMSARVSGSRKLPCSIESTPAAMAALAAVSPWQCVATFLPRRCASSTMAWSSSGVSCGVSTASASERTLDDVGAVLHLVAHGGAALVGAVADAFGHAGRAHDVEGKGIAVGVTTGGADGVIGREDARPHGDARADGVAQADVQVLARAEVTDGGEAGVEQRACVRGGVQRLLGGEAHEALELVAVEIGASSGR